MAMRGVEGLIWLVFAALVYALTFEFDQPLRGYAFGATAWPRAIILMIGIGAVGLLTAGVIGAAWTVTKALEPDGDPARGSKVIQPTSWRFEVLRQALEPKRLLTFSLPLIYVAAMHRFGFLIVSPLFLIAYMYLFGYRRWPILIAVNLIIYSIVLLVFVRLLYTHFPPGLGVFHSVTGQFVDFLQ